MENQMERFQAALTDLKVHYNISVGPKIDQRSCRRISILVSELFATMFARQLKANGYSLLAHELLEPETYRIAKERRLTCDPMEDDSDFRLKLWEFDKKTGFNTKLTGLDRWIKILWEDENGRATDIGSRCNEHARVEKAGAGIYEAKRAQVCPGF